LLVAVLFFADALALWHLYIALSVNGIASAFSRPAMDASVPLLVPQAGLQRAAGLAQASQAVEMIVAPSLAGLLVGTLGLGAVFVADFISFGASIVALVAVILPQPSRSRAPQVPFTL
jgi:DHA3 family macrolide efflux protein-like MFS transporter